MTAIERAREAAVLKALFAACEAEGVGHEPNTAHGCWIDGSFNGERFATALLASLREDGMVLVPRVATDAMASAAAPIRDYSDTPMGESFAREVWSAMIAAAQGDGT